MPTGFGFDWTGQSLQEIISGNQAPMLYALSLLINIGFLGIAALGLNILVGFTGQISIGHAAFFGLGAFTSAWLHEHLHVPVMLCIPLAGLATALVGLVFGAPAVIMPSLAIASLTIAVNLLIDNLPQKIRDRSA